MLAGTSTPDGYTVNADGAWTENGSVQTKAVEAQPLTDAGTSGQEGEEKLVGSYSTRYDPSLPRAVNVSLAAERIHGTILQPGQLFSFGSAVQPRIPENGYVLAPAIGGNEYGGGICQVSSTLYAAMCHAMIPAVERHAHSSRVSYLPAGLDATISEGYKDLKFINPYQKPLTILTDNRDGILTVSLYLDRETQEGAEPGNAEAQGEGQQNEEQQNEEQQGTGTETAGEMKEGPGNTKAAGTETPAESAETEKPAEEETSVEAEVPEGTEGSEETEVSERTEVPEETEVSAEA